MTIVAIILLVFLIASVNLASINYTERKSLEDEAIRRGYGRRTHRTFEWASRGEVWGKINAEIIEDARKEARESGVFKRMKNQQENSNETPKQN